MAYFYEVKYTFKPGMRSEFIAKLAELDVGAKSRAESGNRKYEYVVPANEKDSMMLFEIWESLEAQKVHCTTEHFIQLGKIKSEYVLDTAICATEIEDASLINK